VTFSGLGERQPQVGRDLVASGPADPDAPIDEVMWQWSRGDTAEGPWTDIAGATSESRAPVAADEGMYLRATVTYNDRHDDGKMVSGVTPTSVEERTVANAAPKFTDETGPTVDDVDDAIETGLQNNIVVLRAVDEGKKSEKVGKPILAKDGDNDTLRYTIVPANDNYAIDPWSGQVTTKTERNSDDSGDTGDVADDDGEIVETFTVRATDPSGAYGEATVKVTINDVNDAPTFNAGDAIVKELWVTENIAGAPLRTGAASDATALAAEAYVAADADAGDAHNTNTDATTTDPAVVALKYSVEGADKGSFAMDAATGVLTVKADHTPNYEGKKEYSITVVARDNETPVAGEVTQAVKVNVVNAEDAGKVSLSAREPQVGKSLVATLSDGDGSIRGPSWQWYRNVSATDTLAVVETAITRLATDGTADCEDATTDLCIIDGATSPNYTPVAADEGDDKGLLAARVTYSDTCVRGDGTADPPVCAALTTGQTDVVDSAFMVTERDVQVENPGNTAPKFADDQDPNTTGNQEIAERSVPENMDGADVGEPVNVSDSDLVKFSLGGPDAASFKLGKPTGNSVQIQTAMKLDFETKPMHVVVVTATDPSGASDDLTVNITVEDGPDDAIISLVSGVAPEPEHLCVAGGAVPADADANLANDCQILLDGMDELIGDVDGTLNWSADTPIGEWDGLGFKYQEDDVGGGVEGEDSGRVLRIYLKGAGLSGEIPDSFNELSALRKLTLSENDLTGAIPDLSDLDLLTHLVLNDNMLSGSVPMSLGDMAELDYLYLHRNDLSGSIPAELGDAMRLRRIWLHGNDLSGMIPMELGNLSRLRYLVLSSNMLEGEIPAELADATSLKQIYLQNNMLSGMIPMELGNIMDDSGTLRRLYLQNNMLTGMIPSELGMLTDLTHLRLSGNMLEGCVPADIADAVDDGLDLMACDDGS